MMLKSDKTAMMLRSDKTAMMLIAINIVTLVTAARDQHAI